MPIVRSADLKVIRARAHFNTLKEEITAFLDSDPYTLVVESDDQTGEQVVRIKITQQPSEMWPVLIGEIIHNLRSALDHIVYGLRFPGETIRTTKSLEFPIFDDEANFLSNTGTGGQTKIRGLREDARRIIEAMQPYNNQKDGLDPHDHPIWVLHELWNWDKHSLPHITHHQIGTQNFKLTATGGARLISTWIRDDGPIEDGTEVARFRVVIKGEGQVKVEGELARQILFDENGPGLGASVIDGLEQIGVRISRACALFWQLP